MLQGRAKVWALGVRIAPYFAARDSDPSTGPTTKPSASLRKAYSPKCVELDFIHLAVLHTAEVSHSTGAFGTFVGSLPHHDP